MSNEPPERAEAHVYENSYGTPCCSACGKTIGPQAVWRCPRVGCRKWFRTRAQAEEAKRSQPHKGELL